MFALMDSVCFTCDRETCIISLCDKTLFLALLTLGVKPNLDYFEILVTNYILRETRKHLKINLILVKESFKEIF